MGEMASSVAHELNQPLTAINNYCNGLVSRIKGNQITEEDLLAALDKTAPNSRAQVKSHREKGGFAFSGISGHYSVFERSGHRFA